MSHQTIVARLGSGDNAAPTLDRLQTLLTEINFLKDNGKLEFGLDKAIEGLGEYGLTPTDMSVDLALLAATVTAADTRISRRLNAQDFWTREIALHIPVADPVLWGNQAELLSKLLNFLTGDRWSLHFRERPEVEGGLIKGSTKPRTLNPTSVCLFSGGLDSFIGAIDLLSQGLTPLFVSHHWDSVTAKYQRNCSALLKARYSQAFGHVRAHVGFKRTTFLQETGEDTLRGRSFLFFSLAALAADSVGERMIINVPENGLISLNVPLDPLRVGALSTRTTHPFYMARFNELLTNLGINAVLHNSYAFKTKGEMALECRDQQFIRQHASNTMSCSSPQSRRYDPDPAERAPKHCGRCVPCLIRRASLHAAFRLDETPYRIPDLNAQTLDSRKAEGEHVRAFQLSLAKLATNPGRAKFDVHKPGPLSDHPDSIADYVGVYTRGMEEVGSLLNGVVSRPKS
ncbi:Qat anti-phage system QueC-like protein QatC [Klebsiella michiganensis]|uniref:Qat anti-phage system QueC-like protein QatC n=1 Tax=Klebsiella michiganensis TaxID=1134687 RepID=UPI0013D6F2B0|nr:Qat anti-phage system QueC-like protein QatC [Klebsiella michiganensis]